MNIIITGHHLEITPALEYKVKEKLARCLASFGNIIDVKVKLSIDNSKEKLQRAECMILVKNDKIFAETANQDMYAAIDELVDKIQRQVVKYKEKNSSHRKTSPKIAI